MSQRFKLPEPSSNLRDGVATNGDYVVWAIIGFVALAASVLCMIGFFRYDSHLWAMVCFFPGLLAFAVGLIFFKAIYVAMQRNQDGRVLAVVESSIWDSTWPEPKYTEELTRHLLVRGFTACHQVPMQRVGTICDIVLEQHRGEDWFITVKKGLDNQKRLTLQGEIEDALERWIAKGGRRFHVLVVLGFDDKALKDLTTQEQKKTLIGHLEIRHRHYMPSRKPRQSFEYDVCVVPITPMHGGATILVSPNAQLNAS